MLTLKFFDINGLKHVVSCAKYSEVPNDIDDVAGTTTLAIYDKHDGPVSAIFHVGKNEFYQKMYAENIAGKTIDKVS